MFKFDSEVDINLPALSGRGKIKGISAEMPIGGCIYIVEVTESNSKIPNKTYPYTHIVAPEIYLTIAAKMPKQERDNEWKCCWCGNNTKQQQTEGTTECPKRCSKCGRHVCPICGNTIVPEKGSNEDVLECGGGCIECSWEHCGNCI